jgi:HD-GYP domain-containing protein (c-di-GMP phosphodiesterase class II)
MPVRGPNLLGAATLIGLGAAAWGQFTGSAVPELGGVALLGLTGLAAVMNLRRPWVLPAVRPGPDGRGAASRAGPPTAPGARAEPDDLGAAIDALAAQLRSSAADGALPDRALARILDRFVAGHACETANHTLRVGEMARTLALLAGLPPAEAEMLKRAAPLHDVGQAGIPAAILNKPGKFSAREFALVQKHTTLGHRILSRSDRPLLKAAATIALQHHERWDGMGYPQRLQGEDIHIHARIVGLVDSLDAMFSRRSYRSELTTEHALGIIRSQRGHHFDPRLVDLVMANFEAFAEIGARYADEPAPAGAVGGVPRRGR